MATKKRRKTTSKVTRRRRSLSGVPAKRRRRSVSGVGSKTDVTTILSVVAGTVLGRIATVKFKDKLNPKMMAGAQIIVGYFAPSMIKNKMVQGIGMGLIVNGAVSMLNQFGVIGAISGTDDNMQMEYLSGGDELLSIAGDDDDNMSGIDDGVMSGQGSDRLSILAGINDFESELSGLNNDDNNDDY